VPCASRRTQQSFGIEHGLHGAALSRVFVTANLRTEWEPSLDQSRSRGLSLPGRALLFAYARFGRSEFRCTLCPQRPLEETPQWRPLEPCRTCGMATPLGVLDADPPRLVVCATAGGAFTEIVPSSDVSCRPRAPSYRFQADRQLPPRARSREHEDRFTRLTRIVPPASPERERMEERPKTPSVVSNVL